MKRFLTFKPPLIRTKPEKSTKNLDCLKATANLAAVETAEHDTEAVSHKTRDATSLECNSFMVAHLGIKKKVLVNIYKFLNLRSGFDYQAENYIYICETLSPEVL